MNHPLDDLFLDIDKQLPEGWVFDGVERGLLCWIATAVSYPSKSAHRVEKVSAASPSVIEAVQKMINRTKAIA